ELVASHEPKWRNVQPEHVHVKGESKLKQLDDGSLKTSYKVAAQETYILTLPLEAGKLTGLRLAALTDDELPAKGPGRAPNGNFVLTTIKLMLVDAAGKEKPLKIARAVADHSQQGFDVASSIDGKGQSGWAILPKVAENHEAIFQLADALDAQAGFKLKV